MSAITANPSLLFPEGRSRIYSKNQRNYQKVSQANLDDAAILAYLKAQQLHRTIAVFTAETHSARHIQPILKCLQDGAHSFHGQVRGLISSIRELARGKQNFDPKKMLKVQFFIYIWYCVDHSQLNKSRLAVLRQHIDRQGETLAEIPQLLAYFALPYSENPSTHPVLRKIFTAEWREHLKNDVLQLIGQREEQKMEQEWFNIIKDLIEISTELYRHLDATAKTAVLRTGMERVTLYKMVIEKNETHSPLKQQGKSKSKGGLMDLGMIERVKEVLQQLGSDLAADRQLGNELEMAKIYHGLQLQLSSERQLGRDKLLVGKMAKNDVLLFHSPTKVALQRQSLKLAQLLSSYYIGRRYLQSSAGLVSELGRCVLANFREEGCNEYNLQMLYVCFDILQKLVIRPAIFDRIIKEKGLVEQLVRVFVHLRERFLGGGTRAVQLAITACAAVLMGITMHRQGRRILSKTSLFQSLVFVLQKMGRREGDEVLEKAVCSCIYLLLVEPQIRIKAAGLKLKDVLLDRMMRGTSTDYETIVQYIIERSEVEGGIEDEDSDQDAEKSIEYDETIEIRPDQIWHRSQRFSLKEMGEAVPKGGAVRGDRVTGQKIEGRLQRQRSSEKKSKYSRDKYSWKK